MLIMMYFIIHGISATLEHFQQNGFEISIPATVAFHNMNTLLISKSNRIVQRYHCTLLYVRAIRPEIIFPFSFMFHRIPTYRAYFFYFLQTVAHRANFFHTVFLLGSIFAS